MPVRIAQVYYPFMFNHLLVFFVCQFVLCCFLTVVLARRLSTSVSFASEFLGLDTVSGTEYVLSTCLTSEVNAH